jgi:hypothetical protein
VLFSFFPFLFLEFCELRCTLFYSLLI